MKDHLNTTFMLVDKDNLYVVKFLKELDIPINTVYRMGLHKAYEVNDFLQSQHLMMEYLQDEGYVKYEKFGRDSGV